MPETCKHHLVRRTTPHCLNCGASLPDPKDEKILKAIVAAVVACRGDALRPSMEMENPKVFAARVLAAAREELEA